MTTVAAAPAAVWRSTSVFSVLADSSGTSPDSRTSVPVAPAQRRLGGQKRVAGPELWLLDHKREACVARQRRLDGVRLVADDDGRRLRREGCGSREHVLDHRQAGDAVQHLRPRGFHPRALARREDDDVECS